MVGPNLSYYLTPTKNNHLMFTGGILEEMFNGFGMEYLHFATNKNYAYGFELFKVRKRDCMRCDLRCRTMRI